MSADARQGGADNSLEPAVVWVPVFVAVMAVVMVVLTGLHDSFWYGPDEGAYAYVAERILAGDVLNDDVQDIHLGYVNFANAAVRGVFGDELVVLRYPLVLFGVFEAAAVFLLMRRRSLLAAVAGALGLTSLSFIQFLNPSAHWWVLALTVATAVAATVAGRSPVRGPPASLRIVHRPWFRDALLGHLVVTTVLFRQLSGAILGMAVVTLTMVELDRRRDERTTQTSGTAVARALAGLIALGLVFYLTVRTNPTALVLFGVGPLALLTDLAFRSRVDAAELLTRGVRQLAGGVIALAPLVAYHVVNGSTASWFGDTVGSAVGLTEMTWIRSPSLLQPSVLGLLTALRFEGPVAAANGLYWVIAPLLALVFGIKIARNVWGTDVGERWSTHPLPLIAAFHALVTAHFQIPVYLAFSLGLTVVGLLWAASATTAGESLPPTGRVLRWAALTAALAVVGIGWQAAQPLTRSYAQITSGDRIELVADDRLGTGLRLDAHDLDRYGRMLDAIEAHVAPDEPFVALPSNPELYTLSGRRSPFRFFNASFGLRAQADIDEAVSLLERAQPPLVLFDPGDKYVTEGTRVLMARVRTTHSLDDRIGDTEVWVLDR